MTKTYLPPHPAGLVPACRLSAQTLTSACTLVLAFFPVTALAQDAEPPLPATTEDAAINIRADVDSLDQGAAAPNAAPAFSQDLLQGQAQSRDVFPAAFFDVYVPRTALDMIARIPGFQIRTGDTGRRGLGQGGANILINGERLPGKADPFDQLDQILAGSVVEIRIREGATLNIPGLSGQVADVVVKKSDGLKGTWEWRPEFRKRLQPNLTNGEVNLNGETDRFGGVSYAVTLRDFGFRSGALGTETISDASGTVLETRREDIKNTGARPGIAVTLGWTPKPDHKANLNASYFEFDFNRTAPAVRTPLTDQGSDLITFAVASEDEWNIEVDGDYEFPFWDGRLKFTGVYDFERSPMSNGFERASPGAGFLGASRFDQLGDELELVGRAEYGWTVEPGRDWQIAGEIAYNELDIDQELFLLAPGEEFVSQGLQGFKVGEDRSEATLTHNRRLTDKWDVQASLGVEYSRLEQETLGAAETSGQEFVRPKGFISASYKASETLDIRTKVEREVGQLNFFDFISSVDLEDSLDRSANPDLVPAQSWLGSLEMDKDFGQGNTVRIEVYGAVISDTVDRIPIGLDGDGVGNIGTAIRYGVDVVSTLKGDRWGLTGTELNLTFDWRNSSVDDPVLGFSRRLNGDKEIYYSADFRHDIPSTDWAWGAYLERFISARQYRLFSIDRNGVDKPYAQVFIEHKDLAGMTARVSAGNLFGQEEFFERTRFTARRDQGVVQQFENIKFNFGPILRVSLSGDF